MGKKLIIYNRVRNQLIFLYFRQHYPQVKCFKEARADVQTLRANWSTDKGGNKPPKLKLIDFFI